MKNNSIVMIALFSIIIHASISGSEKSSVITSAPTIGRMITHQIYGPVLSNIQNVQKLDRRPLLIAVDYNSILGDDSHRFDGANPHRNLHFRARENILTSSRMSGPHVEIAKKTPPKKSTLVTIEQVQKNFARYNQTSKENMQPQPTELRPQSSQQSMITSLPSSSKNIISTQETQQTQPARNITTLQPLRINNQQNNLNRPRYNPHHYLPTITEINSSNF